MFQTILQSRVSENGPRPATRKEHERISVANDDESERLAKKRKKEVKAPERQDVEEARRSLRAKDSE